MRILHVTYAFPPTLRIADGITTVVYHVTKELAKRGHEVSVYASNAADLKGRDRTYTRDLWIQDNLLIRYSDYLFRWRTFFFTPSIVGLLKDTTRRFDVIHIHDARSFQGIVAYHFAHKNGVPYVYQPHGSFLSFLPQSSKDAVLRATLDRLVGFRVVRNASRVLALAKVEACQYESIGIPRNKIAVIPNGIDLSAYERLPTSGSFKARFGIDIDSRMILYIGRIHKYKGIDFLLKACAKLFKRMKAGKVVLVIAGPDDGFAGEVRSLVNELGVKDQTVLTGKLSEREKLCAYVDSTMVINVEPINVFGLVPLEAAACSRPVIVSSGNAISTTVIDGGFGFSVDYGNVDELSEVIAKMLNDDHLTAEMGRKGRQYVFRNFDWVTIVNGIERVYKEVAILHNWRS